MVTYGKTLGGGLPVGVVCGKRELMKRFRDERPADICFARGTFNAHPAVMASMSAFLDRLDGPQVAAIYDGLDARWNARAARFNAALEAHSLPVRVANLSSIWTVLYTEPVEARPKKSRNPPEPRRQAPSRRRASKACMSRRPSTIR